MDDLVLPGQTIAAGDEILHEGVGTIARAACDGRKAAMAELIDVVLDRPVLVRLGNEVGPQLCGDDLVRSARRSFGKDRPVEVDEHALTH